MDNRRILGVDAGSVTVSVVEIDGSGRIFRKEYRFHNGHPRETLEKILDDWNPLNCGVLAATRSASPLLFEPEIILDDHVAVMKAARHIHGRVGSLLSVGGEKFGLFSWSGEGEYRSFKGNTSCAAAPAVFWTSRPSASGSHPPPNWLNWPNQTSGKPENRHPMCGFRENRSHPCPAGRILPGGHCRRAVSRTGGKSPGCPSGWSSSCRAAGVLRRCLPQHRSGQAHCRPDRHHPCGG
jgi:hypothetical protein